LKFASKKNEVLLRDGVVEKHASSIESAVFEGMRLQKLRGAGIPVPALISCEGSVLKLEYISAETLPDLIDRLEKLQNGLVDFRDLSQSPSLLDLSVLSELETAANAVIDWLSEFYRAISSEKTGEIRGDVNGRNFLLTGGSCVGVDFEEQVFGTKEQDIGKLVAFVLTYDPQGTEIKAEFARKLMQRAVQVLNIDEKEAVRQRDLELAAMQMRRSRQKNKM